MIFDSNNGNNNDKRKMKSHNNEMGSELQASDVKKSHKSSPNGRHVLTQGCMGIGQWTGVYRCWAMALVLSD